MTACRSVDLRHLSGLIAAGLIMLSLAACTALTSEAPSVLEREGRAPDGVHYYLPRAVVRLDLSVNPAVAAFRIEAKADAWSAVPDSQHRYFMRYIPRPQYNDHITIALGPSTNFLKSVSANTTDMTPSIFNQLGQLAGALLESEALTDSWTILSQITVDPGDPHDLARAAHLFNVEVKAYSKAAHREICKHDALEKRAGTVLDLQRDQQCKMYMALAAESTHVRLALRPMHDFGSRCTAATHVHYPAPRSTARPATPKTADCSVGLCYRPARPYELCMTAGKSLTRSIHMIPQLSPLVEIEIKRAFLVNKVQSVTFDNDGLLTDLSYDKGSELLALSSLPLEVLNGLFDGLKIRVQIIENLAGDTNAQKDLLAERAKLAAFKATLESAIAAAEGRQKATSFSGISNGRSPAIQSGRTLFDTSKIVR
jgi:hypothetical protein